LRFVTPFAGAAVQAPDNAAQPGIANDFTEQLRRRKTAGTNQSELRAFGRSDPFLPFISAGIDPINKAVR
jgi:hypothetical protein